MSDAPTDPAAAVIPPTVLNGVLELGRRHGCDIARWFDGTGLVPDVVEATDATGLISFRQSATVLSRALRDLPAGPTGMQVGARDVLLSFGMLGVALRSCASVADAIALGAELHQASGSMLDVAARLDVDPRGAAALQFHERFATPALTVFLAEEALVSIVILIRSVLGADWSPAAVELAYQPPAYATQYRDFFGVEPRFAAPVTQVLVGAEDVRRPLRTHHEPTRAMAVAACRQLLDRDGVRQDLVAAVEGTLTRNLREPPTMAQVAELLHLSERSLRRQLEQSGVSYRDLRDRVREQRATGLLRETTLTMDAIAAEVGMSEAREFRRAYRRWTGMTPSAVRARSRP